MTQLLADQVDGIASPEVHTRLELLLDTSEPARQFYVDYLDLHANLLWERGGFGGATLERLAGLPNLPMADANDDRGRGESTVLGFLSIAAQLSASWLSSPKALALTVVGCLGTYFLGLIISIAVSRAYVGAGNPTDRAGTAASAPARIIADAGCRWQDRAPEADRGGRLPAGTSRLTMGVVELEFDGGAHVSIEGPAEFAARSGKRLELTRGRLTAYVPKQARGFTVDTPTAEVVDLGTEFGVQVDGQGSTDLHVLRGRVEVKPAAKAGGSPGGASDRPRRGITVTAGQAVRVSSGQGLVRVAPDEARFSGVMPATKILREPADALDLVDLISGGSGGSHLRGAVISLNGGTAGKYLPLSEHDFPLPEHGILDGRFIPNGSMQVDSAGHNFEFPATNGKSWDGVRAVDKAPWGASLATNLDRLDGQREHVALCMHANAGLTIDLAAVRRLIPGRTIVSFRATAGINADETPNAKSDVFVLVDGELRYERRKFTSADGFVPIPVRLTDADRFLTLASTDGGDAYSYDWVIFGNPSLGIESSARK